MQCGYFSFETAYSRKTRKRRRKRRSDHRKNFLESNISENRMGGHMELNQILYSGSDSTHFRAINKTLYLPDPRFTHLQNGHSGLALGLSECWAFSLKAAPLPLYSPGAQQSNLLNMCAHTYLDPALFRKRAEVPRCPINE